MIALAVHGGATTVPLEEVDAYLAGCRAALDAGWAVLARGGSAIDASEAAVRVLEADPTFNAGYGGALNADGDVELCASIMEGDELCFGSVAIAMGLPHPISVARRLLETQGTRVLGARGAERFAREQGFDTCEPSELITEKQRKKLAAEQSVSHDTVGCVALDANGLLATAVSTGGLAGSPVGRIGDSPLPGCGFYADSRSGGCVFTGDGEQVAQLVLAKMVVEQLAGGVVPEEAARHTIALLADRVDGEGGCIVLDRSGRIGWAHSSSEMACAYRTSAMNDAVVALRKPGGPSVVRE